VRKDRVMCSHIYMNNKGELPVTVRLIVIITGRSIITGMMTGRNYHHESIIMAPEGKVNSSRRRTVLLIPMTGLVCQCEGAVLF
jgi:hypothetical protein